MRHSIARVLTKWRPTASALCPRSKKRWSYVAVMLKTKHKSTTPENSLATGGSFERNTFLFTALDWLKKEEDEQFRFLAVSGLPL